MPFAFDEDQRALVDGVESLLSAKATGAYARAVIAGEADWLDLWEMVAELGIPGMAVPEERRRASASGRSSWSRFANGSVATWRPVRWSRPPAASFRPRLAAGGDAAAPWRRSPRGPPRDARLCRSRSVSASLVLSDGVVSADPSSSRTPSGCSCSASSSRTEWADTRSRCCRPTAPRSPRSRASTPPGRCAWSRSAPSRPRSPRCREALADLSVAFTTAAAELVGVAARMLELSVKHAQEREQFGSPIGAFQASSTVSPTPCSNSNGRAPLTTARPSSGRREDSDADPVAELRAARMAKAAASDAATEVGRAAVQVHGGVGITVEHDVSLFYLRARQASMQLGGRDAHYAALAARARSTG